MSILMFVSMFVALGLFYLIIGVSVSKKISTIKDYFLAGRDLGLGPLTFTLVATQIGGGMLLGSADAAYRDGYFGIFYSVGMSVGFLLLGFGLASKLRQFEIVTTAQLFELKYGSTFLRKVASVISAVSMMGIFAAQVVASRLLFNVLGIGNESFLILFWVFVIIYTVMGGLKAVVITDIFQVIFLVSIVSGVFVYSLFNGGISISSLGSATANQAGFASFGSAFTKQLPVLLTAAIYPLFGQDLTQRFFAARTKKIAALGAILAGVVIIGFAFVPVYFGMAAKIMNLTIPANTSVFYSVIGALTNDFILALVGCALIAAITSTADSLLCGISSNVVQDFGCLLPLGCEVEGAKRTLLVSKITTLISGVIGVLIAYFSKDILSVMCQSYGVLISALFVPVLFCLISKKLKKEAAFASLFAGAASFFLIKLLSLYGVYAASELMLVVVPVAVSFVGYVFGAFIGQSQLDNLQENS